MSSLSHSSNQILQPNIAGGANPSNAHFTNAFGSRVGGVSGCAGAGNSPAALAAKPGYNWVKMHHQKGAGMSHRRGGNKHSVKHSVKRSGHKKSGHKKSAHKKSAQKRSSHKRSSHKRSSHKRSSHKRSAHKKRGMRGGLSALSPSSFSGAANLPYHQFTSGEPLSFVYGLGGNLSAAESGLASPPPMNIHSACGPNYGLVGKGLLN